MKENGQRNYKEQDLKTELCYLGEPISQHETDWFPKLPPRIPNIQYDPRTEELQDQADDLRMTPRLLPEEKPAESNSWLSALKNKWKKKNQ